MEGKYKCIRLMAVMRYILSPTKITHTLYSVALYIAPQLYTWTLHRSTYSMIFDETLRMKLFTSNSFRKWHKIRKLNGVSLHMHHTVFTVCSARE